jgi:hypothetical protein
MERPRPNFIELPYADTRAQSSASHRSGLTSPRIQHFDGDIPPALSPLDAFAAQSRRLARELEETRKAGERRMSRLPPQIVSKSLDDHNKNKPQIFRALSSEDQVPQIPEAFRNDSGISPQVSEPRERPQSSYPRFSGMPERDESGDNQPFMTPLEEAPNGDDYFDAPRAQSPVSLSQHELRMSPVKTSGQPSHRSSSRKESWASTTDVKFTLAPPNAAFARRQYHESSDDDYTSSNAGSTFSQIPRKLSSSSGMSAPHSPVSVYNPSHDRSPSLNSNNSLPYSVGGSSRRGRSTLNFSRPMSSSSLTNLTVGSPVSEKADRHISTHLQESTPSQSFDDSRSAISDGFAGESSSYTHTKWTLPRGRKSDRTSALFLGLSGPHFQWQDPNAPGTPPGTGRPSYELPVPSPSIDQTAKMEQKSEFSFGFAPEHQAAANRRPSSSSGVASSSAASMSTVRPKTANPPKVPFEPPPIPNDEVSRSSRSNSTVRPSTARSTSAYQSLSADEHVTKGIDLHQHGDLKESTYHLRIAAKQEHPTGMLLYALACRHGWGLRPNQPEGAIWLRKAVDHAMLEIADDEDPKSTKPKADAAEMKAHKAQFALAIYEMGQCHLNGWGMEQDKALALRCYEIAGNWGDTDALTEAGFCYAQGIGCKKNMKKAAKFYRMAEKRGVSMVGNSW